MYNNPAFDTSSFNTPRAAIPSPGQAELPSDRENMIAQLMGQVEAQSQATAQIQAQMQQMFLQLQERSVFHPDLRTSNDLFKASIKKPEMFSGQGKSMKEFSRWRYSIERAFPSTVDEVKRIENAATYLEGPAWRFFESRRHLGATAGFTSLAEMLSSLEKYFSQPYQDLTARESLLGLTQRGSVIEYTERYLHFNSFVPDRSEADRVFFYLKGLKPDVNRQATAHGMPKSLEEAMQAATLADQDFLRRRNHETSWRNAVASRGGGGAGPSRSSGPQPMELGNMFSMLEEEEEDAEPSTSTSGLDVSEIGTAVLNALRGSIRPTGRPTASKPGGLTDAERMRLFSEERCFYCKEQGHMRDSCPKLKLKLKPQQSKNAK